MMMLKTNHARVPVVGAKRTTKWPLAAALCVGLLSANMANATDTLISEMNGLVVYDQTTNLSWIANANLAAADTFGVTGISYNGFMNWSTAESWITAMNASKYLGYSNWALPTSDTCNGYYCTGSQMGNLFYNGLGQVAGQTIATTHNANYSLFNNVQSDYYWSGTEYAPNPNGAWNFNSYYGNQNALYKFYGLFALAVRPGQVSAVPEPSAVLMFGVGLLALIGVGRRRLALW